MYPEIFVVGASAGGLTAIGSILANLPADFAMPIAIVQHRSVGSGELMLRELRRYTTLPLQEPYDNEPVSRGRVYIAPADYHLLLEPGKFRLSTEGPVNYARPSIDVLFESAAHAYGCRAVAVILTGANSDGARGAARIKQAGGVVVVQNPEDAECPIMPQAAIESTSVDHVLSLSAICSYLAGNRAEKS